jgi:hydrogenase maturation protease
MRCDVLEGQQGIVQRVLIIAYGNPLRCDDGIAWQAAEELRRQFASNAEVSIICVHQLTPELAEDVSCAETVIFLDATQNEKTGKVGCEHVALQPGALHFSHHLAPGEVLAFSNQLYGASPRGFLISIHGEHFDHGETLSATAINALPQVVTTVTDLVKRTESLQILS